MQARFSRYAFALVALALFAFASTASAQSPARTPDPTHDTKKPAPRAGEKSPEAASTTPSPTPPRATAPAAADDTAAKLAAEPSDEATAEDKRAIYISVDFGFARADVGGISDNTGFDETGANGIFGGLGVGARFKELRLGARFRDSSTTEYSLLSLMGEVGYGLPFRPVSPVLFAHAGYVFDTSVERSVIAGSLPRGNVVTPNVELDGLVVGAEVVANVSVTKFLRVGPFVGFDFSWLHRAQLPLPQSVVPLPAATRTNALFSDSGSGVGYLLSIGLRGTGDIAF